jgi:hypothetical protein
VHLAARTGDGSMLGLLLDRVTPEERLELVNQPDSNGITPVYLALQRWGGQLGRGLYCCDGMNSKQTAPSGTAGCGFAVVTARCCGAHPGGVCQAAA